MDAKTRQAGFTAGGGNNTTHANKTTHRSGEDLVRTRFWLRTIGIALFLACPWLYLLLVTWAYGTAWLFIPTVAIGPLIIYAVALIIHYRGKVYGN